MEHVPLSQVSKHLGRYVKFYMHDGSNVAGKVEGISTGTVHLAYCDIRIQTVKSIEVE
jgi:hypothetical protein